MLKRDIQGKFALKDDDYRQVRSVRLTSETWKALGIAAECLGMSRADFYFLPDSTIFITPINALQKQILSLMKMPESLYQIDSIVRST